MNNRVIQRGRAPAPQRAGSVIPDIEIGRVYDIAFRDAPVHYGSFGSLADPETPQEKCLTQNDRGAFHSLRVADSKPRDEKRLVAKAVAFRPAANSRRN